MSSESHSLEKMVNLVDDSSIASIQNVVSGIVRIINDVNSSVKDLTEVIKLDPPLVAKILKVANSAYYASLQTISKIDEAVMRIGFNQLNFIALGQKVHDVFDQKKTIKGYSRNLLWKHSVAVGILGKIIIENSSGKSGDDMYAAGLLHDIGIIAEDQFLKKEDFVKALGTVDNGDKNLHEIENEILGYNHASLGQAILENWNFPNELSHAVGCHHNYIKDGEEGLETASALFLADYLCQKNGYGYSDSPFLDENLFNSCLKQLGITPDDTETFMTELAEEISKIEKHNFFG